MKYGTAQGFRAALERQLGNMARERGIPGDVLYKRVVLDRFLASLVRLPGDNWRLKGALALVYRLGGGGRFTRDLDIVHHSGEEQAFDDLRAAVDMDLGDYFSFAIEREGELTHHEVGEAGGMRYLVVAYLGGREFQRIKIDVGFSDPLGWKPDRLRGPNLLAFAELEPVEVPAIPLAQHIAEKVHAMTGTYGDGMPSSRAKDLVDLVLISYFEAVEAATLHEALVVTFTARKRHAPPSAIPTPPADWRRQFEKGAKEAGLDPDMARAHALVAEWLDSVLRGEAVGVWDPAGRAWVPPEVV